MGKLIGTLNKSYRVKKIKILDSLNQLIKNSETLKGEIAANNINIESVETHLYNIYLKPIYTIQGKIEEGKESSSIKIKIGIDKREQISTIGMTSIALLGLSASLYNAYHPFLSRKGEFSDIGFTLLFLIGLNGIFKIYKRKKKGEIEFDKLISILKKSN